MKTENIHSSQLPKIDASVKECVNLGYWLLFRPSPRSIDVHSAAYYLKTDSGIFALSAEGDVLETMSIDSDLRIEKVVYFSDLPQPQSLSNSAVA